MAAAVLVLLVWRPWIGEAVDPSASAGDAPLAGIGAELDQLDLGGLVVPAGGPGLAAAETPVLPVLIETAPGSSGGLRRAGPEDALLRNLARPFPVGGRRVQPKHVHDQGDWSLASDELR
jgi:hypothetical protein